MNLIITIPIFRNRFQKPALFFSTQNFSLGSLIFIPYPKPTKNSNRKPALIVTIEDLEKEKFFLRKNKLTVNKLDKSSEITLLNKKTIELILLISEKRDIPTEEVLNKVLTKKIISNINKLSPDKEELSINIQKAINKIDLDFIKNKFKKVPTKEITENGFSKSNIKNIGDLLSRERNEKTSLHSEKHYLVNEIRSYFNETAKKGKGSFSFYLGFFKRIPEFTIYQYWAEVKESRKSIKDQQKLFWWKIGQFLKKKD